MVIFPKMTENTETGVKNSFKEKMSNHIEQEYKQIS